MSVHSTCVVLLLPVRSCSSASSPPPCSARYDVHEMAALKSQFQIASEKGMSQAMFDVDFKVGGGRGGGRV